MLEILSNIISRIVEVNIPLVPDVRTKGDGARAAESIKDALIKYNYPDDSLDLAGHELSHLWAAARHQLPLDTGITVNVFTGRATGAYAKFQIPDKQIDPQIRADIASAPNWNEGLKLTTIRMSDGDSKLFERAVEEQIQKIRHHHI